MTTHWILTTPANRVIAEGEATNPRSARKAADGYARVYRALGSTTPLTLTITTVESI